MDSSCLPRPLMDQYVADLRRRADEGDEDAAARLERLLEGAGRG